MAIPSITTLPREVTLPQLPITMGFYAAGPTRSLLEEYTPELTKQRRESDPSGGSLNQPGKKADQGKDLPWLFQAGFANALAEVVKVTTLGARKYTPNGWATVDNGSERYMEGFARHTSYLAQGEVFDNGPGGIGTYHKAQMIWNLLASLELDLRNKT